MRSSMIELCSVSKRYHAKERLFSKADYFWALRDVSFKVNRGEALGLIGANGAGKTTIMRLISGITIPTRGEVSVNGRVVPLISMEGAVNSALTCRENIYLLCGLFGLSISQIKAEFKHIYEFAGLEKFLDMPLKHFSSGMISRLSFSIAAHIPAEIILIDEVLATGDKDFQEKCFAKMDEYKKQNKTIIFCSHHMEEVKKISVEVIWLDKGVIVKKGLADTVINEYLATQNISLGEPSPQ
jgi:ABC-type polysaccharide/polyol phosphate transport system ATPase subunit